MKKLLLILFVSTLIFYSCDESILGPSKYSVSYKITGTASKVDITIENDNEGTSQFSDISLPWNYNFSNDKEGGTFVYVSAQNQGQSGSVTVTIYKDGDSFKSSTSSGAYVIATASGSL